jgi:hypothetical protein
MRSFELGSAFGSGLGSALGFAPGSAPGSSLVSATNIWVHTLRVRIYGYIHYVYEYMGTYTTCTSTLGYYTTASGSPGQEGEQHVSLSLDLFRLIDQLSLSKATRR